MVFIIRVSQKTNLSNLCKVTYGTYVQRKKYRCKDSVSIQSSPLKQLVIKWILDKNTITLNHLEKCLDCGFL